MKMKTITFCIVYFISCIVIVYSFSLAPSVSLHCSTSPRISFESFPSTKLRPQRGGKLVMGNNAKFGIFSPAVYAAKWVLGDAKLNKVLCSRHFLRLLMKSVDRSEGKSSLSTVKRSQIGVFNMELITFAPNW